MSEGMYRCQREWRILLVSLAVRVACPMAESIYNPAFE